MTYLRANNPREVVRQAKTFERALEITESVISLLPFRAGDRVLDLGCGSGGFTLHLAQRFPKARISGWDTDELLISAARRKASRKRRAPSFEVHSFLSAPLPKPGFDHVVFREVLIDCPDPVPIVRWAASLCRKGGTLSALEWDYGTSVYFPALPGWREFLSRYAAWAKRYGEDFYCGRKLVRYFTSAKLKEVTASPFCSAQHAGDAKTLKRSVETEILSMDVDRDRLLREGGIRRAEYDAIVRGMRSFARTPGAYVQETMVFASGRVR